MVKVVKPQRLEVEESSADTFTRSRLIDECWIGVDEVARREGVSPAVVKSMIAKDRIYPAPVRVSGNVWRIHPLYFFTGAVRTIPEAEARKTGYRELRTAEEVRRLGNASGAGRAQYVKVWVNAAGNLVERKARNQVQLAGIGKTAVAKRPRGEKLRQSWLPAAKRRPQAPAKTDDGQNQDS